MTSERLTKILERKDGENRAARKLQEKLDEEKEDASISRQVDKAMFEAKYDRASRKLEQAVEKVVEIAEEGVARGFMQRTKDGQFVEIEEKDRTETPGEKLVTGQTKGMEGKEDAERRKRINEAVFWAVVDSDADADGRPGEKVATGKTKGMKRDNGGAGL
jgi:hypothetical protein